MCKITDVFPKCTISTKSSNYVDLKSCEQKKNVEQCNETEKSDQNCLNRRLESCETNLSDLLIKYEDCKGNLDRMKEYLKNVEKAHADEIQILKNEMAAIRGLITGSGPQLSPGMLIPNSQNITSTLSTQELVIPGRQQTSSKPSTAEQTTSGGGILDVTHSSAATVIPEERSPISKLLATQANGTVRADGGAAGGAAAASASDASNNLEPKNLDSVKSVPQIRTMHQFFVKNMEYPDLPKVSQRIGPTPYIIRHPVHSDSTPSVNDVPSDKTNGSNVKPHEQNGSDSNNGDWQKQRHERKRDERNHRSANQNAHTSSDNGLESANSNQNTSLIGIEHEESVELYVFNIKRKATETLKDIAVKVRKHCVSKGIRVMGARTITNRFCQDSVGCRITVPIKQKSQVLSDDMWPQSIACRKWENSGSRRNNGSDTRRSRSRTRHTTTGQPHGGRNQSRDGRNQSRDGRNQSRDGRNQSRDGRNQSRDARSRSRSPSVEPDNHTEKSNYWWHKEDIRGKDYGGSYKQHESRKYN